ncbi:hypothetical protein B0H10DRAFT_2183138 [Mycena sp. CBHHK59/15]|nr:hypothetical protein B0H10DRAFT_2183138 [Mycena sp. CBHHK59/15]
MFTKFLTLACLFSISVAAPLLISARSPTVTRDNEGPGTDANGYRCTQHYTIAPGDTCTSVGIAFGLPPAKFINMNPEIGVDCTNLNVGQQYCVQTGLVLCNAALAEDLCPTMLSVSKGSIRVPT